MICSNIKKYWRGIILVIIAVIFFVATSYLNFSTQFYLNDNGEEFVKWASPDETANYVFTKYYAQTGNLAIGEKYNQYASDVMHPRSVRSGDGELKPVSFLGIILIYGKIALILTYKVIPYLTPFFAALGIIYFYLFIKIFFGKNNALLSSLILTTFPPYVYYTARSMFHNVLFFVLLLIALYYGTLMVKNAKFKKIKFLKFSTGWKNLLYPMLAGLFLGLAITVRTSELLWIIPMFLILWIFNIRKIGVVKLIIFFCFLFFAIAPNMYYNNALHGSYFFGGYPEMNKSIVEIAKAGEELIIVTSTGKFDKYKEIIKVIKNNIFHFGFNFKLSIAMFKNYFIHMFPWIFYPGLFGLFLFFLKLKKNKKRYLVYLFAYVTLGVILIFYYGSWVFHDNPDATRHTIGNSYTRYWLPVYAGIFPFVSFAIIRISRLFSALILKIIKRSKFFAKPKITFLLQLLLIICFSFLSIKFVLIGSEEGLVYQKDKCSEALKQWREVIELTEHNSVIVTVYHDKLFFPERKVIIGDFSNKKMVQIYSNLTKYLPVYYYNFNLPDDAVDYLNERRLKEANLQIKKIKKINNNFTLYKINKINIIPNY